MQVKNSELKGSYKKHPYNDNPNIRWEPDSSLFGRTEKWEVRYMIETVLNHEGIDEKKYIEVLEDAIATDLPKELVNRDKAYEWLRRHLRIYRNVEGWNVK